MQLMVVSDSLSVQIHHQQCIMSQLALDCGIVFAGHRRSVTSRMPTPSESHPHHWTPTHDSFDWQPLLQNPLNKVTSWKEFRSSSIVHAALTEHLKLNPVAKPAC